jgi:hypothetical protein
VRGDCLISRLKRVDETERNVGTGLPEVVVDDRSDIPLRNLAENDRFFHSLRFRLPHPVPKAVEVGVVGSHRRRRVGALEQKTTQALPILINADQLSNIFAAGRIASSGDLLIDEGFQ